MKLGEIVSAARVVVRMKAETKWEAIEELIGVMRAAGDVPAAALDGALEAVLARERQISTGMEHGVAVPHGAIEGIDRIVGALGTAPRGIPFDSIDGEPARIVVLLLIPASGFHLHLSALAGVARLFNREAFRAEILVSADSAAAHAAIERVEAGEEGA